MVNGRYTGMPEREGTGDKAANPGESNSLEGAKLLEIVQRRSGIGAQNRAKAYSRSGQVHLIKTTTQVIEAKVTGSSTYRVRLDKTKKSWTADCDCPAAWSDEWCKHAIATAYVAATRIGNPIEAAAEPDKDEVLPSGLEQLGEERYLKVKALSAVQHNKPAAIRVKAILERQNSYSPSPKV